jgi:hypothetical protein
LVKFFAPMQQRIDFLSRDSFFIKKNWPYFEGELC